MAWCTAWPETASERTAGDADERHDGRRGAAGGDADRRHRTRSGGRQVVEDQPLGWSGDRYPAVGQPFITDVASIPACLPLQFWVIEAAAPPVPRDGEQRRRIERPRRRVVEVVVGQPGAGQDLPDGGQVLGPPVVAGAHDGEQARRHVEAGADHRRGLQRLQ